MVFYPDKDFVKLVSSGQPRKELRLCTSRFLTVFDLRKIRDALEYFFHLLFSEGLFYLSPDGLQMGQAESYEFSSDQKRYTFHLRKSCWSDGTRVTAQDFEYTWKSILDPNISATADYFLYPIKNAEKAKKGEVPLSAVGIRSIDEQTLVVDLEDRCYHFLETLADPGLAPINRRKDQANPDWATTLGADFVTNGPFRLASQLREQGVLLEKNPHYWGAESIDLDYINVWNIQSDFTIQKMYLEGALDLLGGSSKGIPFGLMQDLQREQPEAIQRFLQGSIQAVFFNTKRLPFTNANIRRALGLAIDRKELIHLVDAGAGEELIATGLIPPIASSAPREKEFLSDRDIKAAKKHLVAGLQELGMEKGQLPPMTLLHTRSESKNKVAQVLQKQWMEALQINVEIKEVELGLLRDLQRRGNFDLLLQGRGMAYNDPMSLLEQFTEYDHWQDETYDRLLRQAVRTEDSQHYLGLTRQAEERFIREMPIIPLKYNEARIVSFPYVKGIRTNILGDIDFRSIWIDERAKARLKTETVSTHREARSANNFAATAV